MFSARHGRINSHCWVVSNLCHCWHQGGFFVFFFPRAAAVGRLLPLRGNRTLFYPSLDPTYLCRPCSDLAIQSRLSDPWRNTTDWYLTAWWIKSGGLGLSFVSLYFCHCQYVTQSLSFGNSVTLSFVAIDAWRRFGSTETFFCCSLCSK